MTEDDIYAQIGILVIEIQVVESYLKYILSNVLQDGIPVTYARMIELEGKYHKKMLGFFLAEMKKRADYSEELDTVFERFNENRNKLIHRFREVEGHEMSSKNDIAKVQAFLTELSQDTFHLLKFFVAWIVVWRNQIGRPDTYLEATVPKGCEHFLREIKSMTDLVGVSIFLKDKANVGNASR